MHFAIPHQIKLPLDNVLRICGGQTLTVTSNSIYCLFDWGQFTLKTNEQIGINLSVQVDIYYPKSKMYLFLFIHLYLLSLPGKVSLICSRQERDCEP